MPGTNEAGPSILAMCPGAGWLARPRLCPGGVGETRRSPRLPRCRRSGSRWDHKARCYRCQQPGLSFLFFLLPFPPAAGGRRMCQLKAESKEAYADYLPLRESIFGCSAAANSMNRAAIQERSHMRVIVSRIHFTPLPGPEALLLFCSLFFFFFRWQRASQRKRRPWGQVRGTSETCCPVQRLTRCLPFTTEESRGCS